MALRELEIIQNGSIIYGHLQGYLFTKSAGKGDVIYWKCRERTSGCTARITTVNAGRKKLVRRGGAAEAHNHGADPEVVEAKRIMANIRVFIILQINKLFSLNKYFN